jgi:glycosyltransferase involved in cell wall biosynthesis
VSEPLRVTVISHSCVIPANQAVFAAVAEHDDLDLRLIAPARWRSSLRGPVDFAALPGMERRAVPLPVVGSGDLHLHSYRRLGEVLADLRPEVVLLDEDPPSLVASQVMGCQRRLGFRLVTALRQNIFRRYPPPFCWIERAVFRAAAAAAATSQECLDVARRKGYEGPATLVYYPVDTELFAPEQTAAGDRPFTVGYAGRLVGAKGVDVLIAALSWSQAGQQLRVLVVGEGPDLARLRGLAARWLRPDAVIWREGVAHEAMPACYREMDVLVLPSRTARRWKEQFGRVAAEAMACGVPVIGSDSGFIPELIRATGGGVTFPEGDSQALGTAILRLAREPLRRRQLGEAGRAGVIAHYSLPVLARRWHGLLRQVGRG